MKNLALIFSFFIIFSFPFLPSSDLLEIKANKFLDPGIREIYNLKNQRSTFGLLPYLDHSSSQYRKEAAMAFASLQDSIALHYLMPLIKDPEKEVRYATAFAIGQIGNTTVEGDLIRAYYTEEDLHVKATILEALGKCANEKVLISFNMLQPKDSITSAGLAWGIYRAGLKDKIYPPLIKKSVEFLSPENGYQTRLASAHFLFRTKNLELTEFSPEIIKALKAEPKAEVRMAICGALAKTTGKEAEAVLRELALKDPDYRARINAIRALGSYEGSESKNAIWQALNDENTNTVVAAAELIQEKLYDSDLSTVIQQYKKAKNWRIKALLLGAIIKNSSHEAAFEEEGWAVYKKSKNQYEKGALLKALGQNQQNYQLISNEIFKTKSPVIKTYGIEALADISQQKNFKKELAEPYAKIFKNAIQSGDVALIGTAVGVIRNPEAGFDNYFENITFLFEARDRLKLPQEIETYQEIQKTINYYTKNQNKYQPQSFAYSSLNWRLIQSIPLGQNALIKTSKGDILIQLLVEEAPATVANFVDLSKNNFYNGKNFHRVVPNFVVQGGDPRGDGWGSSNYIISSEFSPTQFSEGYIGMASAGKDTESCQWFITHSPAPHLDGKYTNFARVLAGLEVLHKLEPGDIIKSIDLTKTL
ncbi:hypothetical protein BH23BAC1_BH23BAC1_44760 [soil metagenome]